MNCVYLSRLAHHPTANFSSFFAAVTGAYFMSVNNAIAITFSYYENKPTQLRVQEGRQIVNTRWRNRSLVTQQSLILRQTVLRMQTRYIFTKHDINYKSITYILAG